MAQPVKATDSLPSLPQVLIRILDAIYEDQADLHKLSAIILQDAGVAARVIAVANSSLYYRGRRQESLDRAVFHLGTDVVKTLVMTAAMRQLFAQFDPQEPGLLKRVWRSALVTATLSKVLAVLTRFPRPDEAYLSGLMVEIGRLVRMGEDPVRYRALVAESVDSRALLDAERDHYGNTYCDVAADLMQAWGLNRLSADAVRYHLEPAERVGDAHHLVKLVNLAYAMGLPGPLGHDAKVAADLLFGLNEGLTEALRGRVWGEVATIAASLEIDVDAEQDPSDGSAHAQLGERVEGLNQLARLQSDLAQAARAQRDLAVRRALLLTFGVQQSLIFIRDGERQYLRAWIDEDPEPGFLLPLETGRSVVTDAVLEERTVRISADDATTLSIVDRQICGACGGHTIWVQPFPRETGIPGALVLGLDPGQMELLLRRGSLLVAFAREVATALGTGALDPEPAPVEHEALERRIREMVHEASNPLSIINNYLAMLRIKLGENSEAQTEIEAIREEIERVGRILMRVREVPSKAAQDPAKASLNREVQKITDIFSASVCNARGIGLQVELAPGDPPLAQPSDQFRQVLTNLLKNATEALGEQGNIRVRTLDPVSLGGREYTEITVQDDGPGLPAEILKNLFSPVRSTKGAGHSGLGLSIVKRLVDEMDGLVLCSSGSDGTRFQLLLPRAGKN